MSLLRQIRPSFAPLIAILIALTTLGAMALVRASRGPTAGYQITLAPPSGAEADCDVDLTLEGGSRDSLVLFVAADRTALPIRALTITGDHGNSIAWSRRDHVVSVNDDKRITQPQFIAPGPLPPRIHVHYRTSIGVRQGNEHVGFNGECFGLALPSAVAFSGRSVFLVPETRVPLRRVTVTFRLPAGWDVYTPWNRHGAEWTAGVRGVDPLDHLVSATVGAGQFSLRRFRHLGTEWCVAVPRYAAGPEADMSSAIVERVIRYISSSFGRGLGPHYLALILPKSFLGDEVPGEGWATGQGGTLIPATRVRVRAFAERLVDAYTLHAPYRSTFQDQRDFWFPAGLRRYYGTTCLVAVGLLPPEELAPSLALRLATAPGSDTGPIKLERDYDTPGRDVPGGEPAGAALLYDMDRTIRRATSNRRSLDDVAAKVFRGRSAPSPWDVLPQIATFDWARYRERYGVEGHFAPIQTFPGLAALSKVPEPSPGVSARRVRLICTGGTGSFLENCGCKVNQSGGAARRETMLRRLRAEGIATLYLDAGNAFPPPGPFRPDDAFSREETRLALSILKSQGVVASAISTYELTWGLDFYRSLQRATGLPYVSFVTDRSGDPLAAPYRIAHLGNLRVAIVSVFAPPTYVDAQGSYENHAPEFLVPDPMKVLPAEVQKLRGDADLVCVIGRMPPEFVRSLIRGCPGIDIVVSNEPFALVSEHDDQGRAIFHETDPPGFFGATLVLYTDRSQYGLTVADLDLTERGRITGARVSSRDLTDDVPDDPGTRARLSDFYREVGRAIGGDAPVQRPFEGDTIRWYGRYAGVEACKDCHESEYQQWRRTPHANAYKTLLDAHRNYQPRCVACHVVAYGAPHGYRFGDPSARLVNVQCEVCHGPSAEHAANPTASPALRGGERSVCLQCHTPDHSEDFVFEDRIPLVLHNGWRIASRGGQ